MHTFQTIYNLQKTLVIYYLYIYTFLRIMFFSYYLFVFALFVVLVCCVIKALLTFRATQLLICQRTVRMRTLSSVSNDVVK